MPLPSPLPLIEVVYSARSITGATAVYGPGTNGKRDNFLGYLAIGGTLSTTPSWYNQFSFVMPSDASQVIQVKALVRICKYASRFEH